MERTKKDLVLIAVNAALSAGRSIMEIYEDPAADFNIEKKADNSPLTIADKKSNESIMRFLSTMDIPVLSEEGKHLPYTERKNWNRLWIVDPLDGTKEFIKRNGEFTVNIALVENGSPVLGVIYVPVQKVMYWGIVGEGAVKIENIGPETVLGSFGELGALGYSIPVAEKHNGFVAVASRSHMSDETVEFIDRLRERYGDVELVSKGSSLKICLVAEGTADVYPRFAPTMEWDTAAGHAIARAAGFEVWQTDYSAPLTYNKEDLLNPWFIVSGEINKIQ